ncbi:MAG: pentapeptide repeat-containing protein [Haloarculaceae archaeon]
MADRQESGDEGVAGGVTADREAVTERDLTVLHLSPAERDERGISDEEVREAFLAVARYGDAEQKDLRGVTLPELALDRLVLDGADRHPIDLRDATIEDGVSAEFAAVRLPILLDGATVGGLALEEATFETELSCSGATVTGAVDGFEARFGSDAHFDEVTFEAAVDFDEAVFDDDVDFDGAVFEGPVECRGAEFHGRSNLLNDNTSFTGATFHETADFRQAEFGFVHFEEVTFAGDAVFEEAALTGDVEFGGAVFEELADFDEARFGEDTDFAGVEFDGVADFEGASFAGGQRALEEDLDFEGAVFHDEADFHRATFRSASFRDVAFGGPADFEEADFDEDATFAGAHFEADADFENAQFTSANFTDTSFGGEIEFSGSTFSDRIDFQATQVDDDAFVDFTRAAIRTGRIVQPAEGWVRYDMTLASVGDLELAVERESDSRKLLDYFRFCRTEFDEFADHEFDFSDHRDYLDRNAWTIHDFDEPPGADVEYAVEMTPAVVETTYLKAKQAAGEAGDMKVAGEFRVKRQQYSRAKNVEVVRDSTVDAWTRVKNFGRAAENYFLGITCGHGMRPIRIGFAFVLAPLLYVPLYAFGGPLFRTSAADGEQIGSLATLLSGDGLRVLFENARFSYISYTTIGYGFIGPVGPAAEVVAGSEAYLSVVLSALLVYALVKRSEL